MKKIYVIKYNKYRTFKNTKMSHIFYNILVLSINCDNCGSTDEIYLRKRNQLKC